jgi:RNA polymerase sigma factor (sigma-70 family)
MTSATPRPVVDLADHDLVAAVASGDLQALGTLFERFEPGVRRYLGRLGIASSDVDDLVQATFLEVVRAAGRFDPTYPARSWLFGIATVMVRRHRRSAGRAAARAGLFRRQPAPRPTPTPCEILESDDAMRLFARAFERLSPKKREAFVLVTLEGLSGEEAAGVLGIPVKTVWTRLHHARRELRSALGESES